MHSKPSSLAAAAVARGKRAVGRPSLAALSMGAIGNLANFRPVPHTNLVRHSHSYEDYDLKSKTYN